MTLSELKTIITSASLEGQSHFEILQSVAALQFANPTSDEVLDLVIRILDKRSLFPEGLRPVIDDLAMPAGLYPYVETEHLGTRSLLAIEQSRPLNFGDSIIFHEEQNAIYRRLVDGESVILSAPTSFGKSLIIDGVIASGIYSNIVVVLPTLALIDETRRRLQRFRDSYKLITHRSQDIGSKNIFVLTQERVVDFDLPEVDFFVIDEFYKLGLEQDVDRASMLNLAFYKLRRTAKAFYMLGPNIQSITTPVSARVDAAFIHTTFKTVASDTVVIPKAQRNIDFLVDLCQQLDDPTLIYTKSPNSARSVGLSLAERSDDVVDSALLEAADWIGKEYHPDWSYVRCLRAGVGLHHGRIPRALAQLTVRLFNDGLIRQMVCTSTLIEGVNTSARNVMVYDNLLATRKFDFFTFNNIKGRAGRMRKHFIGRVFLFLDPLQEELPLVDIPVISQPDDLPMQVIVEMEEADLLGGAIDRLADIQNQTSLPIEIIRKNVGVDPDEQIQFAEALRDRSLETLQALSWKGYPEKQERHALCRVLWEGFLSRRKTGGLVVSANQMNRSLAMISQMSLKQWIDIEIEASTKSPDVVVEDILDFVRNFCGFRFPKFARAAERIINHELRHRGMPEADYSLYIGRVESQFLPFVAATLDEYGVPAQIVVKLSDAVELPSDIDDALKVLEESLGSDHLSRFEKELVSGALGLDYLGVRDS